MRITSILKKKLLYLLIPTILGSFSVMAQPGKSGEVNTGGKSNDLNITPFGSFKSWYKVADPLGKTIGLNDFNSNPTADSSDIGIFWWNARDIQRVEVVYDTRVPSDQAQEPVIQYWHQTWPETPPRMPLKQDLEDDPWQGRWITAVTDIKSTGNTHIYTFRYLLALMACNSGYNSYPLSDP